MTSENDAGAVKPVIHRSPRPVKNVKEFLALLTHQNSVNYENTIIMYIIYICRMRAQCLLMTGK